MIVVMKNINLSLPVILVFQDKLETSLLEKTKTKRTVEAKENRR